MTRKIQQAGRGGKGPREGGGVWAAWSGGRGGKGRGMDEKVTKYNRCKIVLGAPGMGSEEGREVGVFVTHLHETIPNAMLFPTCCAFGRPQQHHLLLLDTSKYIAAIYHVVKIYMNKYECCDSNF